MRPLHRLRWHHWQRLSPARIPNFQGVAVSQGDCGLVFIAIIIVVLMLMPFYRPSPW